MDIYFEVERLINYGINKNLIKEVDKIFIKNTIFDLLDIEGDSIDCIINENLNTATEILNNISMYAIEKNLVLNNNTAIDLFTTKIMGILTPRPSEVVEKFEKLYSCDKKQATDYFYSLSKDCNYVVIDRIKENLEWDKSTEYGNYKITINVSKPEKTLEEIKAAKLKKTSGYPKCLLCKENEGYRGNLNHPARQNLRIIPVKLNNEKWNIQYSPYGYYNEHCIIFKDEHSPMKISKDTFKKLLDFVEFLPHYFIGSNADLPIVGGSILSHDHFQGGRYDLPMAKAKEKLFFTSDNYKNITLSILKWGMSVIRLTSENKEKLIDLAGEIFEQWKNYSAEVVDIISHTEGTPHNTVTPIARKNKEGKFELDIVLRNNRTTEEFPDGIFHTHKETHHIKQENIGLIEVMGLAILPKRLIKEFDEIKKYLSGEIKEDFDRTSVHYEWVKYLIKKYGNNNDEKNLDKIFKEEIGAKFSNCLVDCGVFKDNDIGTEEFVKFINSIGFKIINFN